MQHRDNPIMAYWEHYHFTVSNKRLVCRICIYRSLLTREEDNNSGIHRHLCQVDMPLRSMNRFCCSKHHSNEQQRRIKKEFKFNNKIHEIAATWDECHICSICNPSCLSRMKIYQNLYRQIINQTPRDKD